MWINCAVLFVPGVLSLALIIGGISSEIFDWRDLKGRKVIIPEIGIVLLAFSLVWMYRQLFLYEKFEYLPLVLPGLIGVAVTSVGVFRIRHDVNFSGVNYACAGTGLFLGSLLWVIWVLEIFS